MIRAFAINLSATLIGTALSTLATFIIIRTLTADAWGASAAALGLGQLVGAALSFGTQIERVRRYSRLAASDRAAEATLDSRARLAIAFVVAAAGFATMFAFPVAGSTVLTAAGVYASLGAANYFIAAKKFFAAGAVVMAEKALVFSVVAVTVLLWTPEPATLPIAQGVAGLTIASAAALITRVPGSKLSIMGHARRLILQYKSGFYIGIASLAPSFLLLDATIVIAVAGSTAAGTFALAARLVAPLTVATSALVTVLMPFLVDRGTQPNRGTLRLLFAAAAVYFALLAGLALSAAVWVPVLFGPRYEGAVLPVQLYIGNAFVVFFTRVLVTVGQAAGDDRAMSSLVSAQVAVALMGIAVGAHLGGSSGAAFGVVATNTALALILAWRTKASTKHRTTELGAQ